MKQKALLDVKGSLWNHLDKKVLHGHRDSPLFFLGECLFNTKNVDNMAETHFNVKVILACSERDVKGMH